jgi:putative transposase
LLLIADLEHESRVAMEDERRREIALFRYALIRPAADPDLSPAQRGRLVRALAARDHVGPDGRRVRVSRPTLDRWVRAYRAGGYDALVPAPRRSLPTTPADVLELAVRLKREAPARTAAQVCAIIAADRGQAPSPRTIQRHFARQGLNRHPDGRAPRTYGRFEAAARNDRWTGDALHGPTVAGRKAYLFAFLDDHSRLVAGHRWGRGEDSLRLEAALRRGLASRGVPKVIYVDNGSAFIAGPLTRACAVLGIRLTHSTPGEPAGRGKIERFFRTVRGQFLVETDTRGVTDLDELNRLFVAWVEQVYHRRVHRETGQTPLARFTSTADQPPSPPSDALLREAFLWSATRTVTKTATVSLAANRYETDPVLAGRRVELVYDPFDLTAVEIRYHGQSFGTATVHDIRTHVHPKAVSDRDDRDGPPVASGIDYLALIAAEHHDATRRTINFADLPTRDTDTDDSDGDGPVLPDPWPHEPPLPFADPTDAQPDQEVTR